MVLRVGRFGAACGIAVLIAAGLTSCSVPRGDLPLRVRDGYFEVLLPGCAGPVDTAVVLVPEDPGAAWLGLADVDSHDAWNDWGEGRRYPPHAPILLGPDPHVAATKTSRRPYAVRFGVEARIWEPRNEAVYITRWTAETALLHAQSPDRDAWVVPGRTLTADQVADDPSLCPS